MDQRSERMIATTTTRKRPVGSAFVIITLIALCQAHTASAYYYYRSPGGFPGATFYHAPPSGPDLTISRTQCPGGAWLTNQGDQTALGTQHLIQWQFGTAYEP